MTDAERLCDLNTPALVLDEARMRRNIARLNARMERLGVTLRPHLKTAKSVAVARQQIPGETGPVTVSTLKEAEVFAAAGVRDILYAVGITPGKLARVQAIRAAGCDLAVVLDSEAQAEAVIAASRASGADIPALIEIDSDGCRSGLDPSDPRIITLGRALAGAGLLRGVMTHAGDSYGALGEEALAAFAAQEQAAAVTAAEALRRAGLACPVVSVGSTPTAHAARDLTGVTEVRAGVYVFFDLVMAGIGVCAVEDIALSVLTTVIGHQTHKGWALVDAGWMALSADRGTARQARDQGYGLVCDIEGRPLEDLIVAAANQEHGIVARRPGDTRPLPHLPVGSRLRILPNHACATGAQHDAYAVIPAEPGQGLMDWPRFRGW
jgi:D-serine deaminase-like pyridoxal phosphate-dependent protein